MKEIKTIEKLVMEILEIYSDSRSDDFILYGYVCQRTNPALLDLDFFDIIINHKKYKMPSYETVSRVRRKVFEKYPELKPEKITKLRKEKEQNFKNYFKY
jgi:hypothetical protein